MPTPSAVCNVLACGVDVVCVSSDFDCGVDFVTSLSGAASSISNVGPGLGDVIGPNGNYNSLPDFSKLSLSLGMLLGRLELFAVLILFFPSFWKN